MISCPPTSVDVGVVPLPDVVDVAEVCKANLGNVCVCVTSQKKKYNIPGTLWYALF